LVPGPETTRPPTRDVHLPDQGVLATDTPHEVDGTVDEYPPEVRVLTLAERLGPRLDANHGTARHQFRELIVGHAVQETDSANLIDAAQALYPPRHQCNQRGPGRQGPQPCLAGVLARAVDWFWLMRRYLGQPGRLIEGWARTGRSRLGSAAKRDRARAAGGCC